ncbi:hypothetical protein [Botrimarina sp.]|uniref:hypothetical protein n=1 Tax=Botrimarina sp. TaxID=2795802 RepID=UPI0032F04AE2
MAGQQDRLSDFVAHVRRRLTARRLWSIAAVVATVAGAALVLLAGARVLTGHAAEPWWYVAAALAAGVTTLVWFGLSVPQTDASAEWADRQWGLQDSLVSWLHFRRAGKQEGFYGLQAKQTAERVSCLDPQSIPVRPATRRWLTAACLVAVAAGLGFMKPSAAVQEKIAQEAFTLAETERINERLEEQLEELTAGLDEEERELIDPDQLREQIEAFQATPDQKQALRQYARLEQELQKKIAKLDQRRNEELAAKAAAELDKAAETRKLAEPLAQKQYDRAAEQLEQMQPDPAAKLTEQQKQAARLRAASQRMAAAAKSRRGASGGSGAAQAGAGQKGAGAGASQGGDGSAGGSGASGGDLGQAMLDLDEAVAELEDALDKAAQQQRRLGECDAKSLSRCNARQSRASAALSGLSKCLSKMAIKRKAQSRLASLCKSCSECQGGLCDKAGLCLSPKSGKNAGAATVESRREGLAEALAAGPAEQLSGIKGDGPSQKSVESADEGSGVSGRTAVSRERRFRRSVESFVSREDVPAGVRQGVKRYFESIHDIAPAAKPTTAARGESL